MLWLYIHILFDVDSNVEDKITLTQLVTKK